MIQDWNRQRRRTRDKLLNYEVQKIPLNPIQNQTITIIYPLKEDSIENQISENYNEI